MKDSFLKSSITLISGTLVAQILAVLISPVMTRLYSEAEIGEYTLILTAVSMFGSVLCGRYDMSIVSESSSKRVFALVKLSILVMAAASVAIALGYAVYYEINHMVSLSMPEVFFWVTLLLLFTGFGYVFVAFNNRQKEYKLITSVSIVREVSRDILLIIAGFLGFGVRGLLVAQCFSVFMGLHRQSLALCAEKEKLVQCSKKEMWEAAVIHRNQLFYSVPANFANSFSYSSLNLFVSNLYGVQTLAYYSMSFRMLGLPLALLGTNVSKVFFEKASREYDEKGDFRKTFLQTCGLLLLVAIPMVMVLMLFAPWLFEAFFGEGWEQAGIYAKYLAPMFGIRLVVTAVTPAMVISKKQNMELVMQMLFFIASITCYYIGKTGLGISGFLLLISFSYSLIYFLYFIVMLHYSKKR